jgi:predicted ribosome quality control (RQC) complex YloA/Tae2 family protein
VVSALKRLLNEYLDDKDQARHWESYAKDLQAKLDAQDAREEKQLDEIQDLRRLLTELREKAS